MCTNPLFRETYLRCRDTFLLTKMITYAVFCWCAVFGKSEPNLLPYSSLRIPSILNFVGERKHFSAQEHRHVSTHKASHKTLLYFKGLKKIPGHKKSHTVSSLFLEYLFVSVCLLHASSGCILITGGMGQRIAKVLFLKIFYFINLKMYTLGGRFL